MTVNSTNITSGPYAGNGITSAFSYDFRIEDASELRVFETDAAGVETELVLTTDYTVSNLGVDAGGEVTRVAGALPSGYKWYIRSNYDETQLTAFASQGGFFPDIHEAVADKLTFIVQQLTDRIGRSIRLGDSDISAETIDMTVPSVANRIGKFLGFGTSGEPVVSALAVGSIASSIISDLVAMRAATVTNGESVQLQHHTNAGDGGGGLFRGVTGAAPATYVDNNGTIIVPSGGDGSDAWLRISSENTNVKWFGIDGIDDTSAIQAAAALGRNLRFPFNISPYVLTSDTTLPSICIFDEGAILDIAATKTVTFTDDIQAGLYQIFTGSGAVSVFKALPEWFGAKDADDAGGPVSSSAALAKCSASANYIELNQQYYLSEMFQVDNGRTLRGVISRRPSLWIDHSVVPFTGDLGLTSWNGVGTSPDDTGGGAVNNPYITLINIWMKIDNVANNSFIGMYMHLLESSRIDQCRLKITGSSIETGIVIAKGPYTASNLDLLTTAGTTFSSNPMKILGSAGLNVDAVNYTVSDTAGQLPLYLSGSDGCNYTAFNVETRSLTNTDPSVHFVPTGSCSFNDAVLSTKVTDAIAIKLDLSFSVGSQHNFSINNIRLRKHSSAGAGNFTQPIEMVFAGTSGLYDFDLAYLNAAGSTTAQEILGIERFTRSEQKFVCSNSVYTDNGQSQKAEKTVGSLAASAAFDIPLHPFYRTGNNYAASMLVQITGRSSAGARGALAIVEFGSNGGANFNPAVTFLHGAANWAAAAGFDHANQKITFTNSSAQVYSDVMYKVIFLHSRNNLLV